MKCTSGNASRIYVIWDSYLLHEPSWVWTLTWGLYCNTVQWVYSPSRQTLIHHPRNIPVPATYQYYSKKEPCAAIRICTGRYSKIPPPIQIPNSPVESGALPWFLACRSLSKDQKSWWELHARCDGMMWCDAMWYQTHCAFPQTWRRSCHRSPTFGCSTAGKWKISLRVSIFGAARKSDSSSGWLMPPSESCGFGLRILKLLQIKPARLNLPSLTLHSKSYFWSNRAARPP